MSKDYKSGYGKPPKHSQFKKGQSGNPKGRPKKSRNIRQIIDNNLDDTVSVRENGKLKRLTYREALVRKILTDGLTGEIKATIAALQFIERNFPEAFDDSSLPPAVINVHFVEPDPDRWDLDEDGNETNQTE